MYTPKVWTNGVDVLDKTNMDHLETQYGEALTSVHKTADETVNNSLALQNDDDLLFAVGANEVWSVFLYCRITTAAAANFKYAFTVPAGGSLPMASSHALMTSGGVFSNNALNTEVTGTVEPLQPAAVARALLVWGVYIGAGAAGNVQLQWAQETADVSDTKVLEDSYIIARQVA